MHDDILVIPELYLWLGTCLAKEFRPVLCADSDDGKNGKRKGYDCQKDNRLFPHGRIYHTQALSVLTRKFPNRIFFSQYGGDEHGHKSAGHLGQNTVKPGKYGTLFGIIGKHSLARLGNNGLTGIADNIDNIKYRGKHIFPGNSPTGRRIENHNQAAPDNDIAHKHVRPELAEAAVGPVH